MNVIFDFDGTLVDSFHCVMEKTNLLADEYQFRKIEEHEREAMRDLSSIEVIQSLKIPFYQIPKLIYQMRKLLRREIPQLAVVSGIRETLERLHQAECTLGILTSNSVENVTSWLLQNKLRPLFSFIHCESRYFSKKYLLKKTLKKYKLDRERTFYIGDETRDLEAAHKNSIKSIAVTWGYNSEKALLQYQPTWLAKTPEELCDIILIK